MKTEAGFEEGSTCNREGCVGIIGAHPVTGCSCHISPPCSAHTSPNNFCPECGWEEAEDPAPEPVVYSSPWPPPLGNAHFLPWWQHYGPERPTVLMSPVCLLHIWSNPGNQNYRYNHPYRVDLVTGEWPSESLVNICDNKRFNGGARHFGGGVSRATSPTTRFVTVYED